VKEVTIDALSADDRELLAAARAARDHAYVPYTQHRVGAAVRAASGKIYSAGNLETVTLQQSVHGERNAVNVMVANGERRIRALVCAGHLSGIPCAECRQVIWEFCGADPDVPIICASSTGVIRLTTIGELYPFPYGPESKNVNPEDH
jgi:cytidine deaminase